MSDIIDNWEPSKRAPFKPGETGGTSVRVNKTTATTAKIPRKKITEADAISWWMTFFEVAGDVADEPEIWALDKEEAKKLGKPTANVYNDMPEKLRKLLGVDNVKNGAFFVGILQLSWYMRKMVTVRLAETQRAKLLAAGIDVDNLEKMPDSEFGATIGRFFQRAS